MALAVITQRLHHFRNHRVLKNQKAPGRLVCSKFQGGDDGRGCGYHNRHKEKTTGPLSVTVAASAAVRVL
jgi:hypothetical protein